MKKLYSVLACGLLCLNGLMAQTFSDNFDSYPAGGWLAQSNSAWKTWTNKPGGSDDVKISNAKAYSGLNSVYFSSVASSGGPSDIVLPFGSELSSGSFTLQMMMYVDAQKKGYFNLQEQTTLGQGWSIDVNFDSLGKFNIVNTTSGTLLTGTYTQSTWMKVKLNIDLNTNTWEFFINDISKGSFQNSYRKIASMDIYPTFNSSFYVDDVSYTITPYTPTTLNGSITFVDKVIGSLSGQKATPVVEIRNLGTDTLKSASIEVTYNGATLSKSISNLNLATGKLSSVTMDGFFNIVSGKNNLVATLTTVNGVADNNSSDNSKTLVINPVIPAIGKTVVAEEATGTWCSWCPRGAVWLRNMDEKYPGYIIGIAVHNNDPMKNANYDGHMKALVGGYPSMLVDRGADVDPSAMEADFLERIVTPAVGNIRNGAEYNTANSELKVSLTTRFNESVNGNYKLAFVLVEDSVTGSGTGWDQNNSYAGGSKGVMGGFEKLPNPVPAALMVYDHVGRIIYPNFDGLSNAFGTTIAANDSFTHNFSIILDPSWKVGRLHIVGLLIEPNGRISNGSRTSISEAIANGYKNGTMVAGLNPAQLQAGSVKVYPNPGKNNLNIEWVSAGIGSNQIQVYTLEGKLMHEETSTTNHVQINCEAWPAGVYLIQLQSDNATKTLKFIKE